MKARQSAGLSIICFLSEYRLAVDENLYGFCLDLPQRVAVKHGDVCILSGFQRADPFVNAGNMGRVDGDGAPGGFFLHSFPDGEAGCQRQMLQR